VDFTIRQRILLMRHPETPANTERFFSGRRDVPLTERGERQRDRGVEALVAFRPDRIWCSPLSRCHDLAFEAASRLCVPCEERDELIEFDFGALEGTRFVDAASAGHPFPWPLDGEGRSMPAPGAESFEDVAARVDRLQKEMLGLDGRTACVSHGGLLRMFFARAYGIPFDRFWGVHLLNVHSLYFTCTGSELQLGGFNLSPEEVVERCTTPNAYDMRNIWGASGRD